MQRENEPNLQALLSERDPAPQRERIPHWELAENSLQLEARLERQALRRRINQRAPYCSWIDRLKQDWSAR